MVEVTIERKRNMEPKLGPRRLLVGAVMAISAVMLLPGSAGATADEHASCPGLAFSEHGPAREVRGEIQGGKEFAESLGVPLGALVREVAHAHLGTHAACGG
jgi:hypothetical protein